MLNKRAYFIKEHVGLLKMTDTYDIIDPENNQQIGIANEITPGWAIGLRMLINKRALPMKIAIRESVDSAPLLTIERGWTFLRSKVYITDKNDNKLGYFKSKIFSFNGGFHVHNMADEKIAEVKGSWKSWDFKFIDLKGEELGVVTKKWSGLGKELFTSADNYLISIADHGDRQQAINSLLLAAGLAIDTVFNEK